MVEYAVQNDIHPPAVGLLDQLPQVLFGAKGGIDGIVVVSVVFVAGPGTEHGGHIEDIHPQLTEVVQPADDAPEGALKVRIQIDGGLIPYLVGHLFVRGEPGGEYLVDHLVLRPAGEEEALLFPEGLGTVKHLLYVCDVSVMKVVVTEVCHLTGGILQLEEIPETDHVDGNDGLVIIPVPVRAGQCHVVYLPGVQAGDREIFFLYVEADLCHIPPFGLQPDEEASFLHGVAVVAVCEMSDGCKLHAHAPLLLCVLRVPLCEKRGMRSACIVRFSVV